MSNFQAEENLTEEIERQEQILTHFHTALIALNNEINRLGRNNQNAFPFIEALNFLADWYAEIDAYYQHMIVRVNMINH